MPFRTQIFQPNFGIRGPGACSRVRGGLFCGPKLVCSVLPAALNGDVQITNRAPIQFVKAGAVEELKCHAPRAPKEQIDLQRGKGPHKGQIGPTKGPIGSPLGGLRPPRPPCKLGGSAPQTSLKVGLRPPGGPRDSPWGPREKLVGPRD